MKSEYFQESQAKTMAADALATAGRQVISSHGIDDAGG